MIVAIVPFLSRLDHFSMDIHIKYAIMASHHDLGKRTSLLLLTTVSTSL